ncbi:MAG: phosphotransferase [Calditrichia bacterium]
MKSSEKESSKSRLKSLKEALAKFFKTDEFNLQELDSGASVRRYYFLNFSGETYFPHSRIVLMQVPPGNPEMLDDYLTIQNYLVRYKIPTPQIFEVNRSKGWIFLARAEGIQLSHYLRDNPEKMPEIYNQLTDYLIALQQKARPESYCPAFQRFFDREKYMFEFRFHVREKLLTNYFRYPLSLKEEYSFREMENRISEYLDIKLPIFVHRDFQSSNIFYDDQNPETPFQIIDFQDARCGNPVYDLVSLGWDSYVSIPTRIRETMVQKFWKNNPLINKNYSPEEYQQIIDFTIIQRKLHDAGAFVHSYHVTGNDQFLPYIRPAIAMAIEVLQNYKPFQPVGSLFLKLMDKKIQNS